MTPADLRSIAAVAAFVACIAGAVGCSILTLAGYAPRLSGATLAMLAWVGLALLIARGRRWV